MSINRTERYAAKQAYQLFIMRAIAESKSCGFTCRVKPQEKRVDLYIKHEAGTCDELRFVKSVPIAKAWRELI